jgi:hypothetical protein
MKRTVLIFLWTAAISVSLSATAWALSKDDVYYGNLKKYSRPAEVNAKKVFKVIPAYKEIIDKNIPTDSAQYLVKLEEANKVFKKIIASYAEDNKYDLVCEEATLANATNITDEIVKLAKEYKEDTSQPSK